MATRRGCSSRHYGSTSNEEEAATTSRAFWFKERIRNFILHKEDGQHPLLTTARMDESLIVLRRALGWAPDDILHLDVHVSCSDGVRYDGRAVLCVEPLLKELPRDLHEAIVALHRNDLLLYKAADDEVADRFLQLGPDGEQERDKFRLRKRQLAFHCQRDGPSSTYRPDKECFDGDPCVPFLINDASFQMYLSRRPPSCF